MSKTFFTADTHFGHENIIALCNRPFMNKEHMDEELIRKWNEAVSPSDTIYHLGDISFHKNERTLSILKQLNGHKCLIQGNHDNLNVSTASQFETIDKLKEIWIDKQKIVMCHFPIESWHQMGHGSWHLHGHTHGSLLEFGKRWDVGVDVWDYAPVSFEQLAEFFKTRPVESRDYHVSKT